MSIFVSLRASCEPFEPTARALQQQIKCESENLLFLCDLFKVEFIQYNLFQSHLPTFYIPRLVSSTLFLFIFLIGRSFLSRVRLGKGE